MSSSSLTKTSKYEKERYATINTVFKALQFSSPDPARGGAVSLPDNGRNANASTSLNGAADGIQIFDHNGDPI